jgi:hypothetical protein
MKVTDLMVETATAAYMGPTGTMRAALEAALAVAPDWRKGEPQLDTRVFGPNELPTVSECRRIAREEIDLLVEMLGYKEQLQSRLNGLRVERDKEST